MNRKSCSSFVPEEDPAIRERMTGRCGQRRACKGSGGDRSGRGDVILDVSDVSVGPGAVRAGSCQPASRAVGPLLPVPRLPQLPGARSRRRAAQPQPGNDFT